MDTPQSSGQPRYMKGKSRFLFWPFLAFVIFAVIVQYLQATLVPTLVRALGNDGFATVYGIQAVAFAVVYLCGMAGFLLAYGIKSTDKAHRVVFIVLAVSTLLPVAKGLISSWSMLGRLTGAYDTDDNLTMAFVNITSLVLPLVASVAWIACLSVIAADVRSGPALRASAIVLALTHLYLIVQSVAMPSVSSYFFLQNNAYETYTTINRAFQILNGILQVAAMAFFFAAYSFGKPKQPKAASANTLQA